MGARERTGTSGCRVSEAPGACRLLPGAGAGHGRPGSLVRRPAVAGLVLACGFGKLPSSARTPARCASVPGEGLGHAPSVYWPCAVPG